MNLYQARKSGSGNKGLDWVIIAGMIAAYPKTADLLSNWSPNILGNMFGDSIPTGLLYGLFCAAMVEGTILFLHFDRRAHAVVAAQTVKWILIVVSFMCQIFDGFVTTETVAQMSPFLATAMTYGIPALPLIIAVMVSTIGALPDDEDTPYVGLKTRLEKYSPKRIWNGDENSEFSQPTPAQVVETNLENEELPKPPNGRHEEVVNPTIGKRN